VSAFGSNRRGNNTPAQRGHLLHIRRTASALHHASKPADSVGTSAKARYHSWVEAVGEAASLISLESRGCSMSGRGVCTKGCHNIGDVLEVDAGSRQALREFVAAHPEEQKSVEDSLRFRQMVVTAVGALRAQEVAA
jgi:hypothetical protein